MARIVVYNSKVQKVTKRLKEKCIIKDPKLESILDRRLAEQQKMGRIESEQWYRTPERWLALTGVANPYKTVFDELRIIQEHGDPILNLFTKYQRQIFFGVGTGDTEIALLRETCDRLPPGALNIYAIDVQEFYLNVFLQQLMNLARWLRFKHNAKSEISYTGYNTLFQNVIRRQLRLDNYPDGLGDMHIALGNVVGNFENQNEIFSQFNRLNAGAVILGVHLARNKKELEYILSLYRDNEIFIDFVLDPYLRAGNKKRKVTWEIDKEKKELRAFAGNTQLAYSKKYTPDELEAVMRELGFEKVAFRTYEQSAVFIFTRVDFSKVPAGLDV